MSLLEKSKKSVAGIANITLVLAVIITALVPITLLAAGKHWELRKEAAEEPGPAPQTTKFLEATTSAKHSIPLLVLKYFPNIDGELKLQDGEILDGLDGADVQAVKDKVERLNPEVIAALEEGSTYHGYKDPSARPSLGYVVLDEREFELEFPVRYEGQDPTTDYMAIMENVDICDYVDGQGIKEVWLWTYAAKTEGKEIGFWESNMAGPYGDVSNSNRDPNDLPVCQKTYTVYHYNYGRGLGEALEDHTHQIEHVLNFVDGRDSVPAQNWGDLLFWGKFVGSDYSSQISSPGCGWTHYPPNGRFEYDWYNRNHVLSDCEDWKPDGSGEQKQTNCETWAGPTCGKGDVGAAFKIWWMQNIPGENNNLLFGEYEKLRNWWDFIGNFDQALQVGKKLTVPYCDDPTLRSGWPIRAVGDGALSSVAVGDVNGDFAKEIVFYKSGKIYVYKSDSTLLWSKDAALGYPVLGDIDSSFAGEEIITQLNSSQVVAWHGDGSVVDGWPRDVGPPTGDSGPVIEDLDGDGSFEVIIPSEELYVLNGSGNELWSQNVFALYFPGGLPARSQYAATTADLTGDGEKEIILRLWRDFTQSTQIMVLDGTTGDPASGWEEGPLELAFEVRDSFHTALGDIDGDGALEIIVASESVSGSPGVTNTFVIKGDRTFLGGWAPKAFPFEGCDRWDWTSQLMLANLNNDTVPEIIHLGYEGCILAIEPLTGATLPGFEGGGFGTIMSYAAVGDINSDGKKEFVSNGRVGIRGDNKVGFTVNSYDADTFSVTRLKTVDFCEGICPEWETRDATFADLDSDGKTEMIIPYSDWIYVFDSNETTGFLDWPQYLHDERHTGAYTAPEEPVCVPGRENPKLPGDLDCDCDVDIVDIMRVAAIWNTRTGDERFNPNYDFDHDGRIGIADIMYVAAKWNTRCP